MTVGRYLRFDRFTLDLSQHCLRTSDAELKLRPRSFEVLRYLAEHPGRLIPKTEIMGVVWRDVVVTDDSLVQCIRDIREVLGEAGQRIVRTVPRRGYLFVADVVSTGSSTPTLGEEGAPGGEVGAVGVVGAIPRPEPTSHWAQHAHRRLSAGVVAVALAILVAVAAGSMFIHPVADTLPRGSLAIAVLPFENVGSQNEQYFGDGLAEELITAISRFRDITVVASNSSFRFRGEVDRKTMRRELGVDFLLRGSVGRDADRIRINVQLIETQTGATRWAERYDRPLLSLFELQDDVADQVVAKVVGHARHSAAERIRGRPPETLEAHELVLRARQGFNAFSRDGAVEAHSLLRKALALDPNHPPAWELLARLLLRFYIVPFDSSRYMSAEVLDEARAAAVRALSLDDSLSSAHDALGFTQLLQGQYEASLATLQRAIELNPNEAGAFRSYGDALGRVGEHRASIEAFQRARRLDPFSPPVVLGLMARARSMVGEHVRALELARECTERAPNMRVCLVVHAVAAAELGKEDEARVVRDRLQKAHPKTTISSPSRHFMLPSDEARWQEYLRTTGIQD